MIFKSLVTISIAAFTVTSCSKSDGDGGGNSGPTAPNPGTGLVAGSDFKNTAKNGAEVSQKLDASAAGLSATTMTSSNKRADTETETAPQPPLDSNDGSLNVSILGSAQVTSFLAESRPRSAPAVSTRESMTLNQGASCGGNMLVLNGVYSKSAEALKGASALLTSLDKELPEGVVSGGATEQFAVTYQIDLSKVNVSTPNTSSATETSGSETSGTAGLPTQDSSNGKESIPVTGLIKIGAGANATEAVLGFGFNAAMDNKGTTGAIDGNFSISANDALKLLKMSADGKLSFKAPSQEGSNKPINIAAETKSLFEIQAGSKPSLHLSGSYSGNGNISKEGAALSDETHMISADVKVAQSNSSDVKVSYSVTVDGKETTGSVEFVTDAYGQCVVKAPASLPKTETTSLSTAAM